MLWRNGANISLKRWRQCPCEEVRVQALDDVLSAVSEPAIDMVKIDLEGHECSVLAGGQTLFTKYRPQVVMAEWKQQHVAACMRANGRHHRYVIGTPWGDDENVAMVDGDLLAKGQLAQMNERNNERVRRRRNRAGKRQVEDIGKVRAGWR
mmetsp:Transcript_78648/g.156358  ORF Transcript_78648/g.156358 Transcript_78648/m.156358 type:complete len:151 (+) Transcript_78648:683-1135(+)